MCEFKTMKEIGAEYGLTSHAVGRLLKENGLRTEDGKPSPLAHEIGMVTQKYNGPDHYIWIWHTEKIRLIMNRLGYEFQQSGLPG